MSGRNQLDARWWERLAAQLIPPAQKAIIDELNEIGRPLTEPELAAVLEARGIMPAAVTHHVRMLKRHGAVEVVSEEVGRKQARYRLCREPDEE
ncbi:MAG TPA: helix-turn-helix domain-containing protein [Solirubrobacterales bacterium]